MILRIEYPAGSNRQAHRERLWLQWASVIAPSFGWRVGNSGSYDAVFCSSSSRILKTKATRPTVCVDLGERPPRELPGRVLVLAVCTSHKDRRFCIDYPQNYQPHRTMRSIPWPIHQSVAKWFDECGLIIPYTEDDLEEIRKKWQQVSKCRRIGFVGYGHENGRRASAKLLGAECYWTDKHSALEPPDYFRWLASCEAVADFPGMLPKTYRFTEAIIAGVPIVQLQDQVQLLPSISDKEAVLLKSWADKTLAMRRLEDAGSISRKADAAYRAGWSVRAIVSHALQWCSK